MPHSGSWCIQSWARFSSGSAWRRPTAGGLQHEYRKDSHPATTTTIVNKRIIVTTTAVGVCLSVYSLANAAVNFFPHFSYFSVPGGFSGARGTYNCKLFY
jgi:hypothetical protein